MVRTTIYLPELLKQRVESYALRHQSSEAAVLREAVERLLAVEDDRSWVDELAGMGHHRGRDPIGDRIDEALDETGFGDLSR